MKIIIGATISRYPFVAGMAWNWIHRILGLQKLGHEVLFVEEVWPGGCVDVSEKPCSFEQSVNRELFLKTMKRFGLNGRACQLYNDGEATSGISLDALVAFAKKADLILNMSGHVSAECVLGNVNRRVYVDEDPVYTQLWHAEYGSPLGFESHDIFFTVGLNIGTPRSPIPNCGVRWHHFLPPVDLDHWPFRIDASCKRFTSVACLRAYPDLKFRGESYQSKEEEFKRFAFLPQKMKHEFEVALKFEKEEASQVQALTDAGWKVIDARRIADFTTYQNFIAQSRGEIGIAKNAYVKGNSGWFSDRSAHYLASGKPVLAQSTGFEHCLPTDCGLLAFTNMNEAVKGIESINRDYEKHCQAARRFAEEHLDYRVVLPKMLEVCVA